VKKTLLFVVVAALALTLVPLALAGGPGGGGWKHGHAKFEAIGKATAVAVTTDPAVASTITVKVKAGSHIKGLKGTEKAFGVVAGAKVWQLTGDGRVARTLDAVAAGDWVKVAGTIAKVDDGNGGKTSVYTITSIKFKDLTPDEATPPAQQ
jgi:hypothetical protein